MNHPQKCTTKKAPRCRGAFCRYEKRSRENARVASPARGVDDRRRVFNPVEGRGGRVLIKPAEVACGRTERRVGNVREVREGHLERRVTRDVRVRHVRLEDEGGRLTGLDRRVHAAGRQTCTLDGERTGVALATEDRTCGLRGSVARVVELERATVDVDVRRGHREDRRIDRSVAPA